MRPRELQNVPNKPPNRTERAKMKSKTGQEAVKSPKMAARNPTKGKECDQGSSRWAQESRKRSQKGAPGASKGGKMSPKLHPKT